MSGNEKKEQAEKKIMEAEPTYITVDEKVFCQKGAYKIPDLQNKTLLLNEIPANISLIITNGNVKVNKNIGNNSYISLKSNSLVTIRISNMLDNSKIKAENAHIIIEKSIGHNCSINTTNGDIFVFGKCESFQSITTTNGKTISLDNGNIYVGPNGTQCKSRLPSNTHISNGVNNISTGSNIHIGGNGNIQIGGSGNIHIGNKKHRP